MSEGTFVRLGASASPAVIRHSEDSPDLARAIIELGHILRLKNLDIDITNEVVPSAVKLPDIHVSPAVPMVRNEIKVEPAAVFVKGIQRQDLLLAASLPTVAVLIDILVRLLHG